MELRAQPRPKAAVMSASEKDETFLSPAVFIFQPVPFGPWDETGKSGSTLRGRVGPPDFDEDEGEVGAAGVSACGMRALRAMRTVAGGRLPSARSGGERGAAVG